MKGIGSWPKGPSMNVQGWERGASVGGGLALIGFGLRRGGLLGLLGAAAGGLLLARGVAGHCALKEALQEHPLPEPADKARYAHMPLDSEVHSADFEMQRELPDTTPMGHETHVRPRQV